MTNRTNPARRIGTRIAAAVLISAAALSAHADRGDHFARALDLTEAQQESMREIRETYGVNREQRQANKAEIQALVESGNVDAAADMAAKLASESVYRRAEMRQRMSEILTPEQMEQLEAMRSKRQTRGNRARRSDRF